MSTEHRIQRAPFAQISNGALRDKTLSYRARGILAMMLSHADGWQSSAAWLEEQGTEGREAIRAALQELEAAGYATKVVEKDEGGRFFAHIWSWFHVPIPLERRTNCTGWAAPPPAVPRETAPGECDLFLIMEEATPGPSLVEQIYEAYPRKDGSKPSSMRAIERAKTKVEPRQLLAAVEAYALTVARVERKFIPHCATWMNGERWKSQPATKNDSSKPWEW